MQSILVLIYDKTKPNSPAIEEREFPCEHSASHYLDTEGDFDKFTYQVLVPDLDGEVNVVDIEPEAVPSGIFSTTHPEDEYDKFELDHVAGDYDPYNSGGVT